MTYAFVERILLYAVSAGALFIFAYWVIPRFTKRSLTRADDIVVSVARLPAALIVFFSGVASSMHLLDCSERVCGIASSILLAVDIGLIGWLAFRLVKQVVRRFVESHARKTESNIDEVLFPIIDRRILPLLIALAAAALILHVFGLRLVSVFTALGAMSFLLLLIFQEPISNLLSGVYLVVDVPFKYGDLLLLEDGTTYRVDDIGARVTRLYNTEEHTLAYIPNRKLAEQKIVNVTRPNVQLRAKLEVEVSYGTAQPVNVKAILERVATGHPHVLADTRCKVRSLKRRIEQLREEVHCRTSSPDVQEEQEARLRRYCVEAVRIALEHRVRRRTDRLIREFRLLSRFAKEFDWDGLSKAQRDALESAVDVACTGICKLQRILSLWVRVVGHLESTYKRGTSLVLDLRAMRAKLPSSELLHQWMQDKVDPKSIKEHLFSSKQFPVLGLLADADEEFFLGGTEIWLRNARSLHQGQELADPFLVLKDWERDSPAWGLHADRLRHYRAWHKPMRNLLKHVKQCRDLKKLKGIKEFIFHETIEKVVECLEGQFPLVVPSWQYPDADFKEFRPSGLLFELEFFLDDLVLEHFQQAEDTCSEVGLWIFDALRSEGISIAIPQTEIRILSRDGAVAAERAAGQ